MLQLLPTAGKSGRNEIYIFIKRMEITRGEMRTTRNSVSFLVCRAVAGCNKNTIHQWRVLVISPPAQNDTAPKAKL